MYAPINYYPHVACKILLVVTTLGGYLTKQAFHSKTKPHINYQENLCTTICRSIDTQLKTILLVGKVLNVCQIYTLARRSTHKVFYIR